jgi:predicted ATP-grasp superfamily ATP-dependent carboligase
MHTYRTVNSSGALKAAILSASPDLIVPADDGVVWQLHALHKAHPELRPLIERSIGPSTAYETIRNRSAFLQVAAALNVRIPSTTECHAEEDFVLQGSTRPSVLKVDGTWGGNGVSIVASREEAVRQFRRLTQPISPALALKRWIIDSETLALWTWHKGPRHNAILQEFIVGKPANAMVACWEGRLLSIVSVEVLSSQGATGAATVVRTIRNDEIERAARVIATEFGLSGFFGLDFMIETATGFAYLIEINPRCTQLGHLQLPQQNDLAGALLGGITGQAVTTADECIHGDIIAFFPQAFEWDPSNPHIRHGFHDVPWEEANLVHELMRGSWPARRWLNRLYFHIRNAFIRD